MVIVRIAGGLGNQMFQYAAGRAYALRRGVAVSMDLSWFRSQSLRQFDLSCFNIPAAILTNKESDHLLIPFRASKGRKILFRIKQTGFRGSDPLYIVERNYRFERSVLQGPDHVFLVGFWQSEKYFIDSQMAIRKDFSFKESPTCSNAEIIRKIEDCCSVALHVRRGDYATEPRTNRVHGLCSREYYEKAVQRILVEFPEAAFFVFSDDPVWARANLSFDRPANYVDHNDQGHAWEDLRLMAHCRHHIIANSSFSWWGAWLATEPNKRVIAPRQWFADPEQDDHDIIPTSWIRL